MSSTWEFIKDATLPYVAYFTGEGFNNSVMDQLKNTQIEDMWKSYFCVTTDISVTAGDSERIHRNGIAWRYVRASMSLHGFLPPLCDTSRDENGKRVVHYLMDGGYVNNLPADIMRKRNQNCGMIFAVDVSGEWTKFNYNYQDSISGWWLLYEQIKSFFTCTSSKVKIPQWSDIGVILAYISCTRRTEDVIEKDVDVYVRPNVKPFGLLSFGKFGDISRSGYEAMKMKIEEMKRNGQYKKLQSMIAGTTSLQKTSRSRHRSTVESNQFSRFKRSSGGNTTMMGTNNMHRSASLISLGKGKNSLLSRPKALDRQRSDETSAKSREKKKMRRFSDSNGGGGGTPHHNSSTSSSPRLGGGGLRKSRIKRSLSGVLFKNS
jgi:predicted acylesterase/phospholipase RssA